MLIIDVARPFDTREYWTKIEDLKKTVEFTAKDLREQQNCVCLLSCGWAFPRKGIFKDNETNGKKQLFQIQHNMIKNPSW